MKPAAILALLPLCLPLLLPAQAPLFLVRYGDASLRDTLLERGALVEDLGSRGIARLPAALQQQCRGLGAVLLPLPSPPPGERCALLFARGLRPDPQGLAVLADDGDLLVVAGSEGALRAARRPGLLDGGVRRLDLDRTCAPSRFVPPAGSDLPDPRLQALVAQVSTANLTAHIAALAAIHTRRADQPQNAQAVAWLQAYLAQFPGLAVTLQPFRSGHGPNVIAELRGRERPDELVLVGAHLDSYAGSGQAVAPGADDNASGCASVLELVRLLARLPLRRTVRFCCWNSEEFGLYGSAAYAQALRSANANVIAYLNTDMNAFRQSGDARDLDFVLDNSTTALVQYLTAVSQTYVPSLPVVTGHLGGGSSDHASFFAQGFPAVFYFEDASSYSPYIHSANDTPGLSTNDMQLATLITQSLLAGVGDLAQPLDAPGFQLDVGSGPTVGGTAVLASGSDLRAASAVRVGGIAVPFTAGANGVAFATPMLAAAGSVLVEIDNPAGTGTAPFTAVPTSPPALRLPATLAPGTAGSGAVGGNPGWFALTLVSAVPGPTQLPQGALGIGGGSLGNVLTFEFAPLSASGGTRALALAVPANPGLSGLALQFQAVTVDAGVQQLLPTNVATLTVQ